jgi:hypothetical protein
MLAEKYDDAIPFLAWSVNLEKEVSALGEVPLHNLRYCVQCANPKISDLDREIIINRSIALFKDGPRRE